jgi:hypothetical protein
MKRLLVCCALALPLAALSTAPAMAEVKTREKGHVKFEGMLGRMFGLFGGKAAREGVVTTTAVKGERKANIGENTSRIVDLSEEKVYDLDMKKKTYTVKTFDEIRKEMREAQEKAEREAKKEEGREREQKSDEPRKEWEIDFDVKETGQKKTLAGYDARQVIMTVTVREKGKALEDGGGMVLTSDVWMGPTIPAMKEVADFEVRYWKQLAGPEMAAVSAEQMAALLAMFPQVKQGMERLQKEGRSADGTPLQTRMTIEAVKSKEQMAQQAESSSGGGGGLGGMLARKIKKREEPAARSLVMTLDTEVQEVSTTVAATDLEIPAGFKQKS